MSSSGSRRVVRYERKKVAAGTSRRPAADTNLSVARHAASSGFMSEMGDAVARLPPRHAPLRICVDANQRSMCAAARKGAPPASAPRRSQARCTSVRGAAAPRRRPPASSRSMRVSAPTRESETYCSWKRPRKRCSMATSEQPAMKRARPPKCALMRQASSMDVGRQKSPRRKGSERASLRAAGKGSAGTAVAPARHAAPVSEQWWPASPRQDVGCSAASAQRLLAASQMGR
mmetsp:Transcript_8142/g.24346  ORF Transcript_8142/g.24346 Transcript_8142/m.24346 type:complete len:232 (+) Transcript_8142:383-1078(+)